DIVSVTGSSGAGKSASDATHHPIRSHNMKSYNVNTHRHIAEIIRAAGIDESRLNFLPTSGPFSRGIFATAFVRTNDGAALNAEKTYQGHPFIRLAESVALANIVGSNYCDLSYRQVSENTYIVQGALD